MAEIMLLCQTLTSSICHEFAGPISALRNSIEFINSSDERLKNAAIQLLEDASRELVDKIKFYSYAHSVSNNNDPVSLLTIKALCQNLLERNNIKLNFIFDNNDYYFTPELSKLIMCLMISCFNNVLKDGIIEITNKNEIYDISIRGISTHLKINNDKIKILTGNIEEVKVDIFNCNEYYIRTLSDKMGYKLSVKHTSDIIEYNFII